MPAFSGDEDTKANADLLLPENSSWETRETSHQRNLETHPTDIASNNDGPAAPEAAATATPASTVLSSNVVDEALRVADKLPAGSEAKENTVAQKLIVERLRNLSGSLDATPELKVKVQLSKEEKLKGVRKVFVCLFVYVIIL